MDSLEFLQEMTPEFPQGYPVFFSPLSTFTFTPDLVPWSRWEQALQGLDWRNIGARSSHSMEEMTRMLEREISQRFEQINIATLAQIDAIMRDCRHFRMGPFELMDLTASGNSGMLL